ncbi:MAG: aminotransferase class I/II-fold pyridoxal phosphate-dependent enzyme [Verrucomicrobiota bacterium]
MTQALHGGDVSEFGRRFEVDEESVLDFSSNLNWFLPEMEDEAWLELKESAGAYGEASGRGVSRQIAEVFGYASSQIMATAGSIEAIYLTAQLLRGRRILIGRPGFADYARAFAGAEVRYWDLSIDDESLNWAEVVIFGSPNNPTGVRYRVDEYQARWPGKTWLVDETFVEFSREKPTAPLEDLILFRSLTKSWRIPGLRVGFLLTSNQEWIKQLAGLQPPWSVSAVAQAWAQASLHHESQQKVEAAIQAQLSERDAMMARLGKMEGFKLHPTDANFFLIELPHGGALNLWEQLGEKGIMVRSGEGFAGLIADRFLRIAVRQRADNERLEAALREAVASL